MYNIQYYALVMNILILLFGGWNSFFPKFNLWDFMTGYFNWSVFVPLSTNKQANGVFSASSFQWYTWDAKLILSKTR